jgi:hypothetical protein
MTNHMTGMLVIRVLPDSPADGKLKEGDVITSVDHHPVANDGTIEFRPKERTSLSYLVQQHQIGDKLEMAIWRDGKPESVQLTLNRPFEDDRLIPMEQYDVAPDYYIYGGVVFCPLTVNLLKAWGGKWYETAPKDLLAMLGNNFKSKDRDEVVLALKVLAADMNEGYHNVANWVITKVNDKPIRNLQDLINQVETNTNRFTIFADGQGNKMVLDSEKEKVQEASILKTYRISQDRSFDMMNAAKPPENAMSVLVKPTE